MIKNTFTYCFIFFLTSAIFCQNDFKNTNFPKEKIFVHVNNNFFLTGEQILYSIYCLDAKKNSFTKLSKIAYVELLNNKNKSVFKQKIKLKNGKGFGDLFLKSSLKTGTYKLISYTQWMRNQQTFFEETIFIVNPFSNKLKEKDSLNKNNFKPFLNKNTKLITLNLNKQKYLKREKVILNLSHKYSSSISISVRKIVNLNLPNKLNSNRFLNTHKKSEITSKKIYLPELRGELFQGKITSKKNDVSNKKVGLSFTGENKITKITSTNNSGKFYFNVNKNYSSDKVTIEVLDNDFDYKINLINNNILEKRFSDFSTLYLTEPIRKHIKELSFFRHDQPRNAKRTD